MSVGQGGDRVDNGQPFLRRIHEPVKHFLPTSLDVPAHIHHVAHRMANPPVDRPHSRREFLHILDCLDIPADQADVRERFGFGIKLNEHGDRLIIAWEAHTEYYSYQVWHIPADKTKPLVAFPAHWAPNAALFYTGSQFPARYRGGLFVAFHGSWNRAPLPQAGYRVTFVPFADGKPAGQPETFAIKAGDPQGIRPSGLAVGPDGSLYLAADREQTVWRIMRR